MASEKVFFQTDFKGKTVVAKCVYYFNSFKEEHLKNHCLTVHKNPKLVAGQKKIYGLFKINPLKTSEYKLELKLKCQHP